jgi:hypothetical protein
MIITKKIYEYSLNYHSSYILLTTSDEIIINGRMDSKHEGMIVLSYNLNRLYDLPFGYEDLYIYEVFKKTSGGELLFFCPDEDVLLYVSLHKKSSSIIPLTSIPRATVFSKIYWWQDDIALLSDYKGNFYQVFVNDKKIKQIAKSSINIPYFIKFYDDAQQQGVYTVYPAAYEYIFKEEGNNKIHLVDFINNKEIIAPDPCKETYDYHYSSNFFLCIGEYESALISTEHNANLLIYPSPKNRFLRGAFLTNQRFVILSGAFGGDTLTVYSYSISNVSSI